MVLDLSNIGDDFVVPILNKFEKDIEMPYGKIKRLRYRVKDLVEKPDTAFNKIIRQVDYLKSTPSSISKDIIKVHRNMKQEISNYKNCSTDQNCIKLSESLQFIQSADEILSDMFPGGNEIEQSLGDVVRKMKTVKSEMGDYRDAMEQVLQYENMADKVKGKVLSHVENAANTAVDMIESLDEIVHSGFQKIPIEDIDKFSVKNLQKTSAEILESVVYYDTIRNALTMTCFTVMLVIVFTNGCGFSGGVIGYDRNVSPVERSCCSHYGGLSLLISVFLGAIFSWLIMLLVTFDFTIGGLSERYVCQAFTPIESNEENKGLGFIENNILKIEIDNIINQIGINTESPITIDNIFKSCRTGKSIFRLLELDNATSNPDFQFALNLDEQIRNLRGGISNSKEIADIVRDTTGQFTKYSTLIDQKFEEIVSYLSDIPFSNYSAQIENYQKIIQNTLILEIENENNTISSFDEIFSMLLSDTVQPISLIRSFQTLLPQLQTKNLDINRALNQTVDLFENIYNRPQQIVDSLAVMKSNVNSLGRTLTDKKKGVLGDIIVIKTRLNQIYKKLQGAEDGWSMTEDIIYKIKAKSDELIDRAEEYAKWAHGSILNELGECRNIYDAYESTTDLFCKNIVSGLNSHWYALGACSFLLPFCLIFGVRLAKFYRRMVVEDKYDNVGQDYAQTNKHANRAGRQASKLESSSYGIMFGPVSRTNPHYGRNGARRLEDVP